MSGAPPLRTDRDRVRDAGGGRAPRHYRRPGEAGFTRAERERVTILFGGLTDRHDGLIAAGLEGLGYRVARIATPSRADYQRGREFGNNGQCNPTYFTTGALIGHLQRIREEQGLSTRDIVERYVFVTAGSCGPCRFGMYEEEYRLALRNAGFDGFRVLVFQQDLSASLPSGEEPGIEWNAPFFLKLLTAILIADLLNEVAYQVRPYETVPGSTDAVFAECLERCAEALRQEPARVARPGATARLVSRVVPFDAGGVQSILDRVASPRFASVLEGCARRIQEGIEVDYTRPRTLVKITGEIWAQTTEGDGNFRMFSFLEREGAEVLVEPLTTWIAYLLHQGRLEARDRRGLGSGDDPPRPWRLGRRLAGEWRYRSRLLAVTLGERILGNEFERLRRALGGTAHPLVDQRELERLAHPYYHTRAVGGEGHLEVGKNIYYAVHRLSHMTLSLKPFGCMPSTQSDGAQAAVVAHHPHMLFLPVETSGEGEVNAYSRVQMALGEAKARCREEFERAVARAGYPLERIRDYVARHRELRRPLVPIPREPDVAGRASNFVLHVGRRMQREGVARFAGCGPRGSDADRAGWAPAGA